MHTNAHASRTWPSLMLMRVLSHGRLISVLSLPLSLSRAGSPSSYSSASRRWVTVQASYVCHRSAVRVEEEGYTYSKPKAVNGVDAGRDPAAPACRKRWRECERDAVYLEYRDAVGVSAETDYLNPKPQTYCMYCPHTEGYLVIIIIISPPGGTGPYRIFEI